MNKIIKAFCLIIVLSVATFTQSTDKYKKKGASAGSPNQQIASVNRSYIKNRQFIKWL